MTNPSNRISAVIVTYYPDAALPSKIARVAKQVDRIVIVDNTAEESYSRRLRAIAQSLDVCLILNSRNEGIARALNQGAEWASQNGCEWLLTLDQDSVVGEDMSSTLTDAYLSHESPGVVAVVGCNFTNAVNGRPFYKFEPGVGPLGTEVTTVITSGSLVSLQAYRRIGGFRDEFFMDCVDLEYCLRARAHGYAVLRASKPLMEHSIGQLTEHRLLWRKTGTSNHSPMRRYYVMRNSLILAREYILKEPGWVFATLWSKAKSTLLIALFEDGRLSKLGYSMLGCLDGLRGKTTRFA